MTISEFISNQTSIISAAKNMFAQDFCKKVSEIYDK